MSEPSQALISWIEKTVAAQLPQAEQGHSLCWQKLSGDAGFRQYFRLNTVPPTLAVVAPPATEKNAAFLAIAAYLRERGVRTPKVIAHQDQQGFMLVEDLGRDLLRDHLNPESAELLYGEALTLLLRLQQLPRDDQLLPVYSGEMLREEMGRFNQWFVEGLLQIQLADVEKALLDALFQRLEASALEQPRVITHRDFHSRNLIHASGSALGVIDFQDAVIGPLTYDPVSLLRDCYIRWPEDQVRRWAIAYAGLASDVGLLNKVSEEVFMRWFDWMGLQRHIKVLGVFARLSLRDGKHGYLADSTRVVAYVRSIAGRYPEFSAFARWFDERLLPTIQQQSWYSPESVD